MTYELEQHGDSVKLTVTHEIDKPDSKLIEAVSNGWPLILASLKSLLETGESLEMTNLAEGGVRVWLNPHPGPLPAEDEPISRRAR